LPTVQLYVIVLRAAVSAPFLVGEGLLPGLIYACFSRFGKLPGVPGRLGSWCQVSVSGRVSGADWTPVRFLTGYLSGQQSICRADTCPGVRF